MADDLQNYKLQLQQVEVTLEADPGNTELLKLRKDLEEIIDLIKTQLKGQQKYSYIQSGSSATVIYDDIEPEKQFGIWKIGDKCQAKWCDDGKYYPATIDGITADGVVCVIFDAFENRSTTTIKDLKQYVVRNEVFPSNKRYRPNQKEYLKKKKQKKLQRMKDLVEEREQDKDKWLNFTFKQSKKSRVKAKSIFATPDNANGCVGIGTCGSSGKPMTDFSRGVNIKHKKN